MALKIFAKLLARASQTLVRACRIFTGRKTFDSAECIRIPPENRNEFEKVVATYSKSGYDITIHCQTP